MAIVGIWDVRGTTTQIRLVTEAIKACDFPFDRLLPSLAKEGKTKIMVSWRDLSRMGQAYLASVKAGGHEHIHEGDAEIAPIVRKVNGRQRVLGLFYLPPYTQIVLDNSLIYYPSLAREVFLAEAAHAVDYHYMNNEQRRTFWNLLHNDAQDLPPGTTIHESGDLGHGHSWFDGPLGYNTWVGESWMEGFVRSFAPTTPVSLRLNHPVPPETRATMRAALIGAPAPTPTPVKVFSSHGSKVYHKSHKGVPQSKWWPSATVADAAGMKRCPVCA